MTPTLVDVKLFFGRVKTEAGYILDKRLAKNLLRLFWWARSTEPFALFGPRCNIISVTRAHLRLVILTIFQKQQQQQKHCLSMVRTHDPVRAKSGFSRSYL